MKYRIYDPVKGQFRQTIPEQIWQAALVFTLLGLVPFTRKDIINHLSDLNPNSVNPIIQAMTIGVPGGPTITAKFRKKPFKRLGRGQYEISEDILSKETIRNIRQTIKRSNGETFNGKKPHPMER